MSQRFHLLLDLTYHKASSRARLTRSLGFSPKSAILWKTGS